MLLARLWELAVFSPPHCSTEGSVICLVALTDQTEPVTPSRVRVSYGALQS